MLQIQSSLLLRQMPKSYARGVGEQTPRFSELISPLPPATVCQDFQDEFSQVHTDVQIG